MKKNFFINHNGMHINATSLEVDKVKEYIYIYNGLNEYGCKVCSGVIELNKCKLIYTHHDSYTVYFDIKKRIGRRI